MNEIVVNRQPLELVKSAKILGMTVKENLRWNDHLCNIAGKASKRLFLSGVDTDSLLKFYCSCVRSLLEYACQLFHSSLPDYLSNQIERIQKRAFRILFPEANYKEALEMFV